MDRYSYSFAVLTYAHDPNSGESLNVGVVLTAPEQAFAKARWEPHYKRLADAFRDFSYENYRDARRDFLRAIDLKYPYGQHRLFGEETDAGSLVRAIWPDGGLSYRVGRTGVGSSPDLEAALDYLFERYVLSQQPESRAESGSTDDQVWKRYLEKSTVLPKLRLETYRIEVPGAPLEFEYAAKNGKWHLIQPLSFDLVRSESIRDKAAKWSGYGHMIGRRPDIEQIVFLLGEPKRASNSKAFQEAKAFLRSVPLVSHVVDHSNVDDLSKALQVFSSH